MSPPDYINAMHCLILIDDPPEMSKMILGLLLKKEDDMDDLAHDIGVDNSSARHCILLPTGFEVYANCPPAFCKAVIDHFADSEVKDAASAKKLTQILSGKV